MASRLRCVIDSTGRYFKMGCGEIRSHDRQFLSAVARRRRRRASAAMALLDRRLPSGARFDPVECDEIC